MNPYNYPDEVWIKDEVSPPLVPSEIYADGNEGRWSFDIEQSEPRTFFWGGYFYPVEEMIEDETPPPLVPSDIYPSDDEEGVYNWEEAKPERQLQTENEELKTEIKILHQMLKKAQRVSMINRLSFRFLLFMAGEVVQSFLSSAY